jgi:hypothetical protein
MIEYRVRLVGEPMGTWITVLAPSPTECIAKATGCRPRDLRGFSRPRVGTERYGLTSDGVVQYWDVEDTRFVPIIARLALYANMGKYDIFRADAERKAVEEIVNATGMFYDDARRQVRIWLTTLDSPHRDTIGLHADE